MKEIIKQVQSIKVKTFLLAILGIVFLSWLAKYVRVDKYRFNNLSDKSIQIQKKCLDDFFSIFLTHKVPLLLFDIDILPKLFQSRPKSWHTSKHACKTLCKHHPEDKNVITFAIQGFQFEGKDEKIIKDLETLGYVVHLSMDVDPRSLATYGTVQLIPTYLWVAKSDHVIHVAFLHQRLNSYMWVGPVRPDDWRETVNILAPALTDGWESMKRIGTKFPTYAQAIDISTRFLGLPLDIDGLKVNVPYHNRAFLDEYKNSHFIECDHERAREYKLLYEISLTPKENQFKDRARKLILKAKDVLDGLKIPFWLSSSTCLGWYRQCDIIPYTADVDIGILIYDYTMKIHEEMHDAGLHLVHKFGKADNSLQLVYEGEEHIKLDISFTYESVDHYWIGGTQAQGGRKYKYKFPKFKLCWTEFLKIKLKVPCDPDKYIIANYGEDWMLPNKNWVWNQHPPNMETYGRWSDSDMEVAVQEFKKNKAHHKAINKLRKKLKDKVIDLPHEIDKEISKLKVHSKHL